MRRIMLVLAVAALAAVLLVNMASVAFADSNPAKDVCKAGFQNVTTPEGAAFKNQGQCIKFVNQGGTLIPVGGFPE